MNELSNIDKQTHDAGADSASSGLRAWL